LKDFEDSRTIQKTRERIVCGLRGKLLMEFEDTLADTETSFQFLEIKRLDNVVVGACFQSLVNLLLVPLRGEQNDIHIGSCRTVLDRSADFHTVHVWHHPIQYHQLWTIFLFEHSESLGAVSD